MAPPNPDRGAGFRVEMPPDDTRYLLPSDRPSAKAAEGVKLAEHFHASVDGIKVDGKPFPWHLHNVALQVDEISPGWYVVYLPLIIEGTVEAGEGVRSAQLNELLTPEPPPVYDGPDRTQPFPPPGDEQDPR